mgnify:CR=1 FL=1
MDSRALFGPYPMKTVGFDGYGQPCFKSFLLIIGAFNGAVGNVEPVVQRVVVFLNLHPSLLTKIHILQWVSNLKFFDQSNCVLKIVTFFPRNTHLITLNGCLYLQL